MVRSLRPVEVLAILAASLAGAVALFKGALSGSWPSVAVTFAAMQVVWIVVRDVRDFIIPDGPLVALAITGAIMRLAGAQEDWSSEAGILLLDAGLCGASFLAIREVFFRIKGFDGMGFGDVKLAAASGMLVGVEAFAWSVFAASALGLAVALLVSLFRPGRKLDRLPFGALLAPACWSIWSVQLWSAP